jgi:hypothetical protein
MRSSSIVALLIALAVMLLHAQPVRAADFLFSRNGSTTCVQQSAAPCTFQQAVIDVGNLNGTHVISCADDTDSFGVTITEHVTIDCTGTTGAIVGGLTIASGGAEVVLRNLTLGITGFGVTLQSGTVILENAHITGTSISAILAQPTSPSTLIVRNCLIDGSAGVLLKPQSGGGLSARFDHVTITSNSGGGIKIDTTSGPVTVDITDSEISSNAGNGLNAVGGAGGPAIFNIHNSIIAKNETAGVQVNGATAAAMIDTTLLDSNSTGATSVVGGGHMLTYGNNRIVGSSGSGFTGPAALQ